MGNIVKSFRYLNEGNAYLILQVYRETISYIIISY